MLALTRSNANTNATVTARVAAAAGFDGFRSDPLGGELCLSLQDFTAATKLVRAVVVVVAVVLLFKSWEFGWSFWALNYILLNLWYFHDFETNTQQVL